MDAILTPHPAYTVLGPTSEARVEVHRHLPQETLSDDDLTAIRAYLQQQRALGKDDFRAMVEAKPGASPARSLLAVHLTTNQPSTSEPELVPFLAATSKRASARHAQPPLHLCGHKARLASR